MVCFIATLCIAVHLILACLGDALHVPITYLETPYRGISYLVSPFPYLTAMERAELLKRIYTDTELKTTLHGIPTRSYNDQIKELDLLKARRLLRAKYKITYAQAKRLVELGLRSKPLREKLIEVVMR